jgi:hypothetical protein
MFTSLCNSLPDRPAGLACAGTPVSSPQEARQKASDDLSRAVAVFPFAVKKLMARLNDQGVGASLMFWEACLPKHEGPLKFSSINSHTVETTGILPAGRGLEWQSLLAEAHFADANDQGSATYSHMVDLFVERHHQLWKVRVQTYFWQSQPPVTHLPVLQMQFPFKSASWQIASIHL